jgi:hypothetical protein
LLGAAAVHAQSTLGAVLERGGMRVTQAQWMAMLPHRNLGFGQQSQNRTTATFTADGKLSGRESLWSGHHSHANTNPVSREISGSWTMAPDGRMCIDQVFGRYEAVHSGCLFMFRLGDYLYHVGAGSEHDRLAPVTRRAIGP